MDPKISVVKESPYGIYVWRMPDGAIVSDEDRNFLSIASVEGDRSSIAAITKAVRYYGITEGQPWFLSGYRKVTDEEYDRQKERMAQGLIPDELDLGAWKDEERFRGKN